MKKFFNGFKNMLGIVSNRNNVPQAALKTESQHPGTIISGNGEEIEKIKTICKCNQECKVSPSFVHPGCASDNAHSFQAMERPRTDMEVGRYFRDRQTMEAQRYSSLPSFSDVAAEVKMSVRSLYQRLHGEGVLYRSRGNFRSERGGNFGYLYVYAAFSRMDLFMVERSLTDEDELRGSTAATLKVTSDGQILIRELAKIPSAKSICRRILH